MAAARSAVYLRTTSPWERGALLPLAAGHFYFFGASSRGRGRPQERGSGAGRRRTTSMGRILLLLGGANKKRCGAP